MAERKRHKPKLQPAGLPSTAESHKLIRERLKQDLPKARRIVVRNRVELHLPTDFAQLHHDKTFPPPLNCDNPGNFLYQNYQQSQMAEQKSDLGVPFTLTESEVEVTQEILWGLPTPTSMLGAGRVDPFAQYPIPVTSCERWLLDRVNSEASPNSLTFKTTWLPTASKDATSFHQFLANVSLDLHWANGRDLNNPISARYHALALKAINAKLSDPTNSTSESVVFSITGFICYNVYREDFSGFDIHISGLAKIIQLRGGIDTLNQNPSLRCMVFGVDLSAACRRDTRPRFKFPENIGSRFRSDILERLQSQLPDQSKISMPWWLIIDTHLLNKALYDIRVAIEFTKYKAARNERWKNVKFLTYWIDPILHTLVGNSFPVTDAWGVMQEATRLGLILFLCKLRQISGQLGVETKLFVTKLKMLLLHGGLEVYLKSLEPMLLWTVVVGLLESWNKPEWLWYVEMTVILALELNLSTWDAVVATVKEVFWIEVVFDDELERCRERFESVLLVMS